MSRQQPDFVFVSGCSINDDSAIAEELSEIEDDCPTGMVARITPVVSCINDAKHLLDHAHVLQFVGHGLFSRDVPEATGATDSDNALHEQDGNQTFECSELLGRKGDLASYTELCFDVCAASTLGNLRCVILNFCCSSPDGLTVLENMPLSVEYVVSVQPGGTYLLFYAAYRAKKPIEDCHAIGCAAIKRVAASSSESQAERMPQLWWRPGHGLLLQPADDDLRFRFELVLSWPMDVELSNPDLLEMLLPSLADGGSPFEPNVFEAHLAVEQLSFLQQFSLVSNNGSEITDDMITALAADFQQNFTQTAELGEITLRVLPAGQSAVFEVRSLALACQNVCDGLVSLASLQDVHIQCSSLRACATIAATASAFVALCNLSQVEIGLPEIITEGQSRAGFVELLDCAIEKRRTLREGKGNSTIHKYANQAKEQRYREEEMVRDHFRREDKRLLQKARALEAMLQLQSLCAPDRRVARRRLKQLLTNTCRKLEELVATAAGVHGDAILLQENARRIAEVVRGLKVKGDCLQNTREARDQELNEVTSILSTICPAVAQPDSTPRQVISARPDSVEDEDDAWPPVREQEPPAEADPDQVKEAYRIIMACEPLKKALRFSLLPFLRRVHEHLCNSEQRATGSNAMARMFGGGKTQSRKTPLKLCAVIMCRLHAVCTVLLTTGTSGRDDLFNKFLELLVSMPSDQGQRHESFRYARTEEGIKLCKVAEVESRLHLPEGVIKISDIGGSVEKRRWAIDQLKRGACLIVNNTAQMIGKAEGLLQQLRGDRDEDGSTMRFVLIMDEADDFYRTDGNGQPIRMEVELRRLERLTPVIKFEVTATLLSIFVQLSKYGQADNVPAGDIFYVEASEEYVGSKLLCPPTSLDPDGEEYPVFLAHTDLNKGNVLIGKKVEMLWQKAMDHVVPVSGYGPLVLDATTPAVHAANQITIYKKAATLLQMHPRAIAIVVAGAVITWATCDPLSTRPQDRFEGYFSPDGENAFRRGEKHFSAILQEIDAHYRQRPVFVFGYSQMMRGLSYRSKRRVPTHFVLHFKGGMSLCRLVQAAGRAMGEQFTQLKNNGFDRVEILTLPHDFDAIRSYPDFLEAIKQKMDDGLSLEEALRERHAGKYKIFQDRTLNQKKLKLREIVNDLLEFEAPQPGELIGADAADRYLGTEGKGLGRAILEVLFDGGADEEEKAITAADIVDELEFGDYDEHFAEDISETETSELLVLVRTELKSLCQPTPKREAALSQTAGRCHRYYINRAGFEKLPGRSNAPAAVENFLPPAVVRQLTDARANASNGEDGEEVGEMSQSGAAIDESSEEGGGGGSEEEGGEEEVGEEAHTEEGRHEWREEVSEGGGEEEGREELRDGSSIETSINLD